MTEILYLIWSRTVKPLTPPRSKSGVSWDAFSSPFPPQGLRYAGPEQRTGWGTEGSLALWGTEHPLATLH